MGSFILICFKFFNTVLFLTFWIVQRHTWYTYIIIILVDYKFYSKKKNIFKKTFWNTFSKANYDMLLALDSIGTFDHYFKNTIEAKAFLCSVYVFGNRSFTKTRSMASLHQNKANHQKSWHHNLMVLNCFKI